MLGSQQLARRLGSLRVVGVGNGGGNSDDRHTLHLVGKGLREIVVVVVDGCCFGWIGLVVDDVALEDFRIELGHQFLHPWCLQVPHDELLVLGETVVIVDPGDGTLFGEN